MDCFASLAMTWRVSNFNQPNVRIPAARSPGLSDNFSPKIERAQGASFSYTLLRRATFRGSFISDDFLAADLQQTRFVDTRATNARFAAADLRESVFGGLLETSISKAPIFAT
jgi:uncharacterized protein YjbI with pentapeptide repeats